jgi:acyl-CoA dehydrogenase
MRPVSREMDEDEHAIPFPYIEFMHNAMKSLGSRAGSLAAGDDDGTSSSQGGDAQKPPRPPIAYQLLAHQIEMLSWGDVGMYLATPGGNLGAAAVHAAGTPEQRAKFLARFSADKPRSQRCMTEPRSDTSAIPARC